MADCHPEIKHFCKGMCRNCYMREFRKSHPEWDKYNVEYARQWRITNTTYTRAFDKNRQKSTARRKQKSSSNKVWNLNNRQKRNAQQRLRNAIVGGKIKRMPCVVCGNQKSEGHHFDYTQALNVIWLCSAHHSHVHHGRIPMIARAIGK